MTNEEAITHIISSESGHSVEIFGLCVLRLENGVYVVYSEDAPNGTVRKIKPFEKYFGGPLEAATCFEHKRKSMKLGFEFEKVGLNSRKCHEE